MRIKEIREERGITQRKLAEMLSTDQTNISRWERGQNEPSYTFVVKLAEVLGVSIGYLVGTEDEEGAPVVVKHITEDLSPSERELLDAFRSLGPFEQESIRIQIKALAAAKIPT